jgi:2-iminobutanoate/2-iminopropanoate deaminase
MKRIIKTPDAPMPIGPYNQAVFTGETLYISGQIPMDSKTNKLVESGIKDATKQVMQNLKAILETAGLTFNHVVKTSIFIVNMDDFSEINEVYATYFQEETAPARETVQVAKLPLGVAIEISMIAAKD